MPGTWSSTTIAGKTADVFQFPESEKPRFGILYLHPYGLETPADNEVFTKIFEDLKLAVVCPHGQRSWWGDKICGEFDSTVTPEKYLLEQVLPYFKETWNLHPRSIGLLGISMGGQGALRLAFKYPKMFPVVAGISSAIDYHELYGTGTPLDDMYDSKEQCRQDTALMHLPPYNSPPHIYFCIDPADIEWYRGNDRLHEKMNALGVEHTCDLTTQAGGHSWEYFNHMAEPAIRFIYQGLEQESLRLL